MSGIRTYARNLTANWVGYGANLVVIFFLTPFIVHSLGDVRYGIWSLLMSVAGYMGLADIGVRPSVGRYVNFYLARGEHGKVNGVISSAMAFFLVTGAMLTGVAIVLGWCFESLFPKIPADYLCEIRIILVVLALILLLGFLSSTLWCLVTAYERFDLSNGAALTVLALRATAIVLVLGHGGGLMGLVAVTLGAEVLTLVLALGVAKYVSGSLRLGRAWVSWTRLRELLGFGIAAFVNAISQRLIYFTNLIIIGWLLGAAEVTYYALGLMFVQYGRTLLQQVVVTMFPEIAKEGGRQDPAGVRWMILRGTRAVMFFTIPLMVGLTMFGRQFIVVWMGEEYSRSATVLIILALGQMVAMSAEVWRNMLPCINHIWHVPALGLLEAVGNLALSIVFVKFLDGGINGVAVGSVVPSVLFMGLVLPMFGLRLVGLRASSFFWSTTFRWVTGAAVAAAVGLGIAMVPLPVGWPTIGAKIAFAAVLFLLLSWVIVLRREDREPLIQVLRSLRGRLACAGAHATQGHDCPCEGRNGTPRADLPPAGDIGRSVPGPRDRT